MTVKEAIQQLKTMPPDSPLYFDCANCGRANEMMLVGQAVLVKTQRPQSTTDGEQIR